MPYKRTIYFIGGLAGMGKSSRIRPKMIEVRPGKLILMETDFIRPFTSAVLTNDSIGLGSIQTKIESTFTSNRFEAPRVYRLTTGDEGEDYFVWKGTVGFIKKVLDNLKHPSYEDQPIDILIDGIACLPHKIRDLENELSGVNVKAAFIGYSKEGFSPKYPDPMKETKEAQNLNDAVGKIGRPNYKYFDLVDSVLPESRKTEPINYEDADYERNAISVVKFLLK